MIKINPSKSIILTILILFNDSFISAEGTIMSDTDKINQQLQDFFKTPEKSNFDISPKGEYLSFMQPWQEGHRRNNIYYLRLDQSKNINLDEAERLTSTTERDIYGSMWANDDTLVYALDSGGDENIHIYSVNINNKQIMDLTPYKNIKAELIDDLENDDEHILVGLNIDDPKIHDVYKINIKNGKTIKVGKNPGNISRWITDDHGKLRIGVTSDGVNTSVLYRKKENQAFETLITTNFKEQLSPIAFTDDGEKLYCLSNIGRDKLALVLYDPEKRKEEQEIFKHDEVDISGLYKSKKTKKLIMASYSKEKTHRHFFDNNKEQQYSELKKHFPNHEISIHYSSDEKKAIIRTFSDKSRGSYHLYDFDKKQLQHLADLSPWLDENSMANMEPISFKARDGLVIHGYLTSPRNKERKKLPFIVNPHGGPWVRDHWGFNPEVQFLASQGYGVLQMNYRGSTGYGKSFWEKGFKQWGGKMQDDITDGVMWLIEQGIADENRIGIYGASYGGYATLAGLTFTPNLYRCGIDYVGISSLFTFMQSLPPYWELYRQMVYEMVGDPEHDKAMLTARSPLLHADKIKAPLFIAQGANDPRVKKEESDQMVEALEDNGIPYQYMVKENEGHGFSNEENRFEFYQAMIDFLNKYMH